MRKRDLCCRPVIVRTSVRPSVRPSVTLMYCIQTAEDIVKLLSQPDSNMNLVFFCFQAPTHNSRGNPFNRGVKYTGVGGKISRFSTEIAV